MAVPEYRHYTLSSSVQDRCEEPCRRKERITVKRLRIPRKDVSSSYTLGIHHQIPNVRFGECEHYRIKLDCHKFRRWKKSSYGSHRLFWSFLHLKWMYINFLNSRASIRRKSLKHRHKRVTSRNLSPTVSVFRQCYCDSCPVDFLEDDCIGSESYRRNSEIVQLERIYSHVKLLTRRKTVLDKEETSIYGGLFFCSTKTGKYAVCYIAVASEKCRKHEEGKEDLKACQYLPRFYEEIFFLQVELKAINNKLYFYAKRLCVCRVWVCYFINLIATAECSPKVSTHILRIDYSQQTLHFHQPRISSCPAECITEEKEKYRTTVFTSYEIKFATALKEEKGDNYRMILRRNCTPLARLKRLPLSGEKQTIITDYEALEKSKILSPSFKSFKKSLYGDSVVQYNHEVIESRNTVDIVLSRYFTPNPPTKRETMAYELLRLCTLHDFPKSTGQSCIRLAQAGFFYEGKDDEVTCFSCSIQICGWQPKDVPFERHRTTSVSCLFITCQDSGNVPIVVLETVAETSTVAAQSGRRASIASSKANFVLEKSELNIESGYETVSSSAAANFASTTSDSQKSKTSYESGYGSKSSNLSQPSDSCNTFNSQPYTTPSEFTSRAGMSDTQTAPQYTVTSTNRNRAHYPEYVLVNDRLQSFNRGWPDYVRQTPQMMVESGFFFAGYDDCVRCFQCGIGLRNWEPPDSPHVEHARWSSKCPFLLGVKGQDFINLVLDAVAQLAIRNEQTANNPPAHIESNPGKAVLLQTNQQIQETSTTTKHPVTTGASARTDGAGSVNTPSQTNTSAANIGSSQFDLKTEAAKKVLQKGFSENEVKRAMDKIVEKEGRSNVTEERILKIIQEEKQDERLRPPGLRGGDATVKAPVLAPDVMELKNKNREMREMTICKICLEEEVSIVFLPCGHLIACAQCAPALSRCAVCRKPITGTVCAHLDV